MRKKSFTLADFIRQFDEVRNFGPMEQIMLGIPGMREMITAGKISSAEVNRHMDRMQAIYNSMTDEERRDDGILDDRRRRRIARGAGVEIDDVIQFMKRFESIREAMRRSGGWE